MFKYQDVFDAVAFRHVVATEKKTLTNQLKKFSLKIKSDLLFIAVREANSSSTLITLKGQNEVDNLSYALFGSPCEQVLTQDICFYQKDVCNSFPNDMVLKELQTEGYIGVSIKNEAGHNIGILVALFLAPLENNQLDTFTLELFADYLSTFVQKCHLTNHTSSHIALLDEVEAMSNTGAWEYHVQIEQVFWSDQIYRIYALPIGEKVTADIVFSCYAEHERARALRMFELSLEKGQTYCEDFEFIDLQGNKKWVRTSGKAEFDENGDIIKILGAFEDISEHKRALLQNQERAHQIENILNNINDAVITIDANGIIQHTNNVALRIFGYQADQLLGLNISNLMPEPYASQHHHYMEHFAKTGDAKIIGIGRQLPAKGKMARHSKWSWPLRKQHIMVTGNILASLEILAKD